MTEGKAMNGTIGTIFGLCILAFMVGGMIWAFRSERRDWNGGLCDLCGSPWVHFDNTSQGDRGWVCHNKEHGYHSIWISYPFIDRSTGAPRPATGCHT